MGADDYNECDGHTIQKGNMSHDGSNGGTSSTVCHAKMWRSQSTHVERNICMYSQGTPFAKGAPP